VLQRSGVWRPLLSTMLAIGERVEPMRDCNRIPSVSSSVDCLFRRRRFHLSLSLSSDMASCMALKRPFGHDCDSSTNPFESRSASPSSKRQRRCFPITVVSSSSAPPPSTTSDSTEPQVFPDVQPVLNAGRSTREKENLRDTILSFQMHCSFESRKKFFVFNDVIK
jgi:hypothetical protein